MMIERQEFISYMILAFFVSEIYLLAFGMEQRSDKESRKE